MHLIDWPTARYLDSHHSQPDGPRPHVLVLSPELSRDGGLVEGVDHTASDRSIRD